MLNETLQTDELDQEQAAQQQFIDDAIHDNAYRYAAAAQKMFASFRREHADDFADWNAFETAQRFLAHANEELQRLVLSRCALLALSASLPKNRKKKGFLSLLAHACWQLTHFSRDDVKSDIPAREEKPETLYV
jgi:hypothetical protein